MSEENLLRARQNCCRLCLAPDSECISILKSFAADKEPLATKIHNCVNVKITSNDRLSLRICHACISYLNSWQSFKNRCIASQVKQRNWLDCDKRQQLLDNNISISTINSGAAGTAQQHEHEEYPDQSNLTSSILDGISSLKKRKSLTVYVSPKHQQQPKQQQQKPKKQLPPPPASAHTIERQQQQQQQFKQQLPKSQQHFSRVKQKRQAKQPQQQQQQKSVAATSSFQSAAQQLRLFRRYSYNPLPAVQIKDEPLDDDEYTMKQNDESDEMMDPTLFLERTDVEGDDQIMDTSSYEYDKSTVGVAPAVVEVKEASCRACHLKFSTRANARRHERNLHPNLFELSTENSTPITKPTAAMAAAMEFQRVNAAAAAALEASKTASIISPQKYRQEVVNAFNNCETGGYDYDSPEKYQDLITDEKIVFLQQNEDFLQQYQKMTCRCCNKYYATYKNFMAHMRKKYATLPRNLCFNCLKLNDSKALFISHLKRRNCINLYKVLHGLMAKNASFAAAVTATAAAAPEKMRAKELLVNKMYECKLCPSRFRLKLEFRSHVYEEHADVQKKDVTSTKCSFCSVELEDPAERKRHYNNMDCIVSLRCVTCEEKFDNHQKFLDHVYEKHLAGYEQAQQQQQMQRQQQLLQRQQPTQQHFGSADNSPGKKSSGGLGGASSADESRGSQQLHHHPGQGLTPKSQYFSRMPQACPICGQQYNNYNNVLRHMESKHPDQLPQTYKCVKCGIGYPRLSNLREHMVASHSADKTRHTGFEYIVNADAVKIADGSAPNVYTGRYDYVMKDLMSITNGGTIAEEDDDNESESAPKKMRMDNSDATPNTSTGGASGSGNMFSSLKECPICNAVFSNNIGLSNHMRSHTASAQSAAYATLAANRNTPSSLTITATTKPSPMMQHQTPAQQAVFRRSLEQAADRRFRRMRCRICQRRFSSKKSYRFHMLNDHQIRNVQFIKCKLCDAEFAYEKGLKVHMFKIHNTLLKDDMIIKQYECDICSIVYRTEDQLLQHKKNVHGNEDAQAGDFDVTLGGGDTSTAGADLSGISTPVSGGAADRSSLDNSGMAGPLYWYQCKYCPSNFNTNKKLAIHINSHDEFDSNDYSCKDCGNVYSGRKSLWVHRYKKHPQIAEPSECVLCKKVFFDTQMLENHIPTCNRKPITATGAMAETAVGPYKHKTGDDEDEGSHDAGDYQRGSGSQIKLPEVACTMCGQRFTDQERFAKHIQMHEMELYTDNPLAAMFDTGPADPNQFFLDRVNDNGEYACDLCQKTFTQMTALKVHRKWHFRGDSKQIPAEVEPTVSAKPSQNPTLISHPHLLGLQAVGLMPNPRPLSKSQKRRRELKCEYCPSTFISNNNLRRHIYELHRDEVGNLPEAPKIETDPPLQCRRCALKFASKEEWIEHKEADARLMKPFGPFQWGCDLCGAYVSRKEKLINHIHNHLKEKIIVPIEQLKREEQEAQQQSGAERKTQAKAADDEDTNLLKFEYEDEAVEEEEVEEDEADEDDEDEEVDADFEEVEEVDEAVDQVIKEEESVEIEADFEVVEEDDETVDHFIKEEGVDVENEADEEEDDVEDTNDDDDDDDDDDTNQMKAPAITKLKIKTIRNSADTTEAEDSPPSAGDDDDDDGEDEDDDDEDDVDTVSSAEQPKLPAVKSRFSCDLCQVFFGTQQELQKHVKMHFLNGPGSVTLTDMKSKSVNKSRSSSSSDVVAVSSS